MSFYWWLLGTLCVWRLTHLLVVEDGPWHSIAELRRVAASGLWGDLFGCFYCLSLWIALPLAALLGETMLERALLWPALSAGAILLERATLPPPRPPAVYKED